MILAAAALLAAVATNEGSAKCASDETITVCAAREHDRATVSAFLLRSGAAVGRVTLPTGGTPTEIRFEKLLRDQPPRIVTLWSTGARNDVAYVLSPTLEVQADPTIYWGFLAIDLDGDGNEEVISTGCCTQRPCATGISIQAMRFDGTRFKPAEKYLDAHSFTPGDKTEHTLSLAAKSGSIRLHIVPVDGARGAVRIDGKVVARVSRIADIPLSLDSECPAVTATVVGSEGAAIWVFVADH